MVIILAVLATSVFKGCILINSMRIDSDKAMQQLGEEVARKLYGGETIELIGDVGAGKTTFVRGLARGLGIDESIQSPTFTISREYSRDDGFLLKHYDFYRLDEPGIMADEIIESSSDTKCIVVVEWSGSIADVLPSRRIVVKISSDSQNQDIRHVDIRGVRL